MFDVGDPQNAPSVMAGSACASAVPEITRSLHDPHSGRGNEVLQQAIDLYSLPTEASTKGPTMPCMQLYSYSTRSS
jgi:hypothetical protein|eukprot:SAG31_NODE_4858_length_2903_cov_1.542439_1_plen_76_part_00